MAYIDEIPKEFWHADEENPEACDVATLIEELKRLPGNMSVSNGFGCGVKIVVYNADDDERCCVEIADIDD